MSIQTIGLYSKHITPAQTNVLQILNSNRLRQSYADQLAFQGKKDEKIQHNPSHAVIATAKSVKLPGTDRVVNLLEGKDLDKSVQKAIQTTAANAIKGRSWNIPNPRAWMITSETETFMKTGGLATVAVDLSNSFNKVNKDNSEREMPIVTPLYEGVKYTLKGSTPISLTPIAGQDNKYKYTGAQGKSIELTKVKTLDVPVYSKKARKMVKENADVLVGTYDGTKYIFLKNDKYFNTNPHEKNPTSQEGPYVRNINNVNEAERMAFLSKAAFVLAKETKENPIKDVAAPNIIVANDWQAGAVSGLTKYLPIAMEAKGEMSKDTANYFKEMPVVNIVHNLEYQGWDFNNSEKILNTLMGSHAKNIVLNADCGKKAGRISNSLIVGNTYNAANANVNLADVVVPVSPNYANEILKTKILAKDFGTILEERKNYGTFVGITNGYTKSAIAPNQKFIDDINNKFQLRGGNAFKIYSENDKTEEYAANRTHNKKAFVSLLQDIKGKAIPGVELCDPGKTDVSELLADTKRLEKTPIITTVGRFVDQKGLDMMAESLEKTLTSTEEGKEKPIFVMLASGDEVKARKMVLEMKGKIAKKDPEAAKRVFVFEGFDKQLGAAIQTAGDLFLVPSRFEPCGITQMEAMAKGNVPVAMATGGLLTTIRDGEDGFLSPVMYAEQREYRDAKEGEFIEFKDDKGKGLGLYDKSNKRVQIPETTDTEKIYDNGEYEEGKEPKNNVEAFSSVLDKALNTFYNKPQKLQVMSQNAMRRDFSWEIHGGSLEKYMQIFQHGTQKQAA